MRTLVLSSLELDKTSTEAKLSLTSFRFAFINPDFEIPQPSFVECHAVAAVPHVSRWVVTLLEDAIHLLLDCFSFIGCSPAAP